MKMKYALGLVLTGFGSVAFAATPQTSARSGIRVAQAGSTPLLASSQTPKNYMQTSAFGYERHSITVDKEANNQTTSSDYVTTDFYTYPSDLSFTGYLSDKFVLRLQALFKESQENTGFQDANGGAITATVKAAGSVGLGYMINPNFELGGKFLVQRHFSEIPGNGNNQKNEFTSSLYMFGPYGVFTLNVNPNMNLEIGALAAYMTGGSETKPAEGATTKSDTSGFLFQADGNAVIALSNDIDYLGGIGLAYQNKTEKNGANEDKAKDFAFTVNIASFRFKF